MTTNAFAHSFLLFPGQRADVCHLLSLHNWVLWLSSSVQSKQDGISIVWHKDTEEVEQHRLRAGTLFRRQIWTLETQSAELQGEETSATKSCCDETKPELRELQNQINVTLEEMRESRHVSLPSAGHRYDTVHTIMKREERTASHFENMFTLMTEVTGGFNWYLTSARD